MSDIMSLLILICDQMQLDGITFVPSQYHLAVNGRRFLRFLEAEDEGWFRALQIPLAGLSLPQSTEAVSGGQLRDRHTGETVTWLPTPMVLPISEQLHDRVASQAYETAAAAAEARTEIEWISPPPGRAMTGQPSPTAQESDLGRR